MEFLTKKIPLFRVWGIRVQLHMLFILFLAYRVVEGWAFLEWTVLWLAVLWGSIFLHELGHCWGARSVGGDATEILMWPLGGLATCEVPEIPRAHLITTAAGPAVNLVLAALGMAAAFLIPGQESTAARLTGLDWSRSVCDTIVSTNIGLFLFNVIPAFPMDGGRLLQELLWPRLGYQRALRIAIYAAFVTGGLMILSWIGVAWVFGSSMLGVIGLWVILSSYRELQLLNQGAYTDLDEPWRRTYWERDPDAPKKPGFFQRRREERRLAAEKAAADAEADRSKRLDEVLRRINEVGRDGLTPEEKNFLELESQRLRGKG